MVSAPARAHVPGRSAPARSAIGSAGGQRPATPALDLSPLRDGLVGPGLPWRQLDVVDETGSTNADLLARAAAGVDIDGVALVAEYQTAGRGRHGRHWSAPPRSQIALSVGVGARRRPSACLGLAAAGDRGRGGRRAERGDRDRRRPEVAQRRPGRQRQAGGHSRRGRRTRAGHRGRPRAQRDDDRRGSARPGRHLAARCSTRR